MLFSWGGWCVGLIVVNFPNIVQISEKMSYYHSLNSLDLNINNQGQTTSESIFKELFTKTDPIKQTFRTLLII